MKIAFCVLKNLAFGGGIEKYTLEVGSRLARRGHDVRVYCMKHYGPVEERVEGMRVIGVGAIPIRSMEKLSASVSAAVRTVLDERCDIVHFHHMAAGWMAWLSRLRGQVCVLQSHGLAWRTSQWGKAGAACLRALERMALKQCDAFTGPSLVQNRYYDEQYGMEAVHIPCGADIKTPLAPNEILGLGLDRQSYVFYLGRLSPEKGVHHLISAFRTVSTDCQLVLAGPSCDEEYQRHLQQLAGEDGRIRFLGLVGGTLREELLSNARIYVQPSDLEGLSIALLEAMSYANCCLVSDIPENLEAVADTGYCFSSGNPESLAHRLGYLLNHPEAASAIGVLARQRVEELYGWDGITTRLENFYRGLLAAPAARAA